MLPSVRFQILALVLAAGVALACGQQESGVSPSHEGSDAPPKAVDAPAASPIQPVSAKDAPARRERKEKPLPALSGWTLDGERLSVSSFIGKRLLIYFFDPAVKDAPTVTRAVVNAAALRDKHNFAVVGVGRRGGATALKEFVAAQGIDFPVIHDTNDALSRRLGLRQPIVILGADAEGYVIFGMAQFHGDEHGTEVIEGQLRTALRLPPTAGEPEPGDLPLAPPFTADILDGDAPFDLVAQRGRAVVVIFFLHTCPHCHDTLNFLKGALKEIPEDLRPALVGIEVTGRTAAVRQELRAKDLDFFPVVFDHDGSIAEAYGNFAGVPDTFLIDAQGRIVDRVQGWRNEIDGPVLRMRLSVVAGAPVPMLLRTKGYSGSEVCGVCHEKEHETWLFTAHSTAFDTLVKHGADSNPECVGCHVVGYGQSGGFTTASETADLEDVGCESCHGRGGPHLSPGVVQGGDYASLCVTCHDSKHSLGFEYASFLPRISHKALDYVRDLPAERKRELLAERGAIRKPLLPTGAAYVGSESCAGCHAAEFATWSKSLHARSVESLAQKGSDTDASCLECHTTAFGRKGGFPKTGRASEHTDLARVGCESCHGPGGDHVAEDPVKIGSIVSLGDKCDSCVILQICGSCHDDVNDPGFEFEVQAKIDAQRHGTIEAGTGKPKSKDAKSAHVPSPGLDRMLGDAFALLDRQD
jgi:peroxiredoxin